jgi:predicted metal-binding membrane protein
MTLAVFLAGVALTIYYCHTMSAEMTMPGGWWMSMAWMRMPGQSWPGAAAMYLAMWMAMMVAMMGPSILPELWEYRRSSPWRDAMILSAGYYFVYFLLGVSAYPIGVAVAIAAMRSVAVSRMVPSLTAASLILAGVIQLTPWKLSHLRKCRDPFTCCTCAEDGTVRAPWRAGLWWGWSCLLCCSGIMIALFVLGMMNPFVIWGLTGIIFLERLLPHPEPVVRISGFLALLFGIYQGVHQWLN